MASDRETLKVAQREANGSRSARRLRRQGIIPGVVYSGGAEARAFQTGAREVLQVLSSGHALFDLEIEGEKSVPVIVKEQQLHPTRGDLEHLDLQEVKLDVKIHAEVPVELEGSEDAPGVKQGGILEQVTHNVDIMALPTDIPDSIVLDVSAMEMHDTVTLSALKAPAGVELIAEEPDEITMATLSPPRVEEEPETGVEEETAVVGEEAADEASEESGDSNEE